MIQNNNSYYYVIPTIALLSTLSLLFSTTSDAFTFDLPARQSRCFTDYLTADSSCRMKYTSSHGYSQFVDVKITNQDSMIIWQEIGKDSGEWSEYIDYTGEYTICFYSRMVAGTTMMKEGMFRRIAMRLHCGETDDEYEELAVREHLKPVELSLRIMEDLVREVRGDYVNFKEAEEAMRHTSEHMFSRAMWTSIGFMAIILMVSMWQARHLKRYFKKKRMLD
eukprot:Tbor_TRINITY_DN880_c0_g1::TRINITY_DN880_c0_g1_i1::g.26664::m.26664/K20352/TMED10, ERV25; p24 family protein delta-1